MTLIHLHDVVGLQGENPWRGLKQPIPVKVGGVEFLVESQYVSNCDFMEVSYRFSLLR